MNEEQIPAPVPDVVAAIPAPGRRRRTAFDVFPLSTVLPCAALGTATATSVIAFDAPLWTAATAGAAVAAVGASRYRKTNIWRILGMRTALWWRHRAGDAVPCHTEPFDVPIPESGGDRCGMRWDGHHLITMVALDRAAVTPTLLDTTDVHVNVTVSLADVARCLAQFDIRLAALDVLILGVRAQGPDHVVGVYEKLLGKLPASAARSMWLVLRLDPLDNAGAIENRGGGQEGMIRTALVATRRVASRLTTRRVRVSVLTAAELAEAEAAALHGTEPGHWSEHWNALRGNGLDLTAYAIPPARLDPAVLSAIWAMPGASVLTRLRMTPAAAADSDHRHEVSLTALVRRATSGPGDAAAEDLGLIPMRGEHRRLLLDAAGLGPSAALVGPPAAMGRFDVPVGGCGQVVGATEDGAAVTVPLFGPAVRRVQIVGALRLCQLMVLRSVAVGARVIVHSVRPEAWEPLIESVGVPAALSLTSPAGANRTAEATMIVYDGVTSAGQVSDATAVHVREPDDVSAGVLDADVLLLESTDTPGEVVLRTGRESLAIRLVSIPEERRYLGGTATEPEPLVSAR